MHPKDYPELTDNRSRFDKNTEFVRQFYDGSDTGLLMEFLIELSGGGNFKSVGATTTPRTIEEAAKMSYRGEEPKPSSQETQAAPQTAPQPPQAQETPQPPPTSETAPEPSQARTKDPVGTLDGETVKEAPPEIFT